MGSSRCGPAGVGVVCVDRIAWEDPSRGNIQAPVKEILLSLHVLGRNE